MNRCGRILAAIERKPPDRFPVDTWCVPEIRQRLLAYCGSDSWAGVLDAPDRDGMLPFSTAEVVAEVAENLRPLGRGGTGYILAPCHNIQAITPLENILAMYQAPRTV